MTASPVTASPVTASPVTAPSGANPVLLLWDIDGTLVRSGAGAYEVYPKAVELLTGRRSSRTVAIQGRTELAIMQDLLAAEPGIRASDRRICDALEATFASKAEAYRREVQVLPGAFQALTAFQREPRIVQSVLTGNIRANAEAKLKSSGLAGLLDFEVGAFGSDGSVRSQLVAVAQERAAVKYQTAFDVSNTVLVGDTTLDVEAGHDGGARVVAVATGEISAEALRKAGAHVVLPDLADTTAVINSVFATVTGSIGAR